MTTACIHWSKLWTLCTLFEIFCNDNSTNIQM